MRYHVNSCLIATEMDVFPIWILMSDSDKTLALLDHVIGYYHVAEEVEPVIRDG